ncbi:MAG: extracellular solute-binding protein [Gloeomargaritaceae cyanobacterium C42_A2020_066]|nr:extracellular solute-binding protein [Gloeomargaritaceae cyanobacterium C42_A2020_066]
MAINRRTLLAQTAVWSLGYTLGGCRAWERTALRLGILKGSFPNRWLQDFRREGTGRPALQVQARPQLDDLFAQLPQARNHLITLGQFWLSQAIAQNWLQPLDTPVIQELPDPWPTLARRNAQGQPDPQGALWAVPYAWGTTAIAYRRDRFGDNPPQDWSDLWQPALKQRLALVDHPREVLGLTLKSLGESYNTGRPADIKGLRNALAHLQAQVRLYSNRYYLQPLMQGDVWAAVGWSSDLLPVARRNPMLGVVVPRSGTALWADLWVAPRAAGAVPPLAQDWLQFCHQPRQGQSLLTQGTSAPPRLLGNASPSNPIALGHPAQIPAPEVLQRSEFLQPLSPGSTDQYRQLWTWMRQLT